MVDTLALWVTGSHSSDSKASEAAAGVWVVQVKDVRRKNGRR
jgi:hypothetical protein